MPVHFRWSYLAWASCLRFLGEGNSWPVRAAWVRDGRTRWRPRHASRASPYSPWASPAPEAGCRPCKWTTWVITCGCLGSCWRRVAMQWIRKPTSGPWPRGWAMYSSRFRKSSPGKNHAARSCTVCCSTIPASGGWPRRGRDARDNWAVVALYASLPVTASIQAHANVNADGRLLVGCSHSS